MKTAILSLLSLVLLAATPAGASENDHERARRAVQAGQLLPLRTILDNVARDYPGDIIETELEDLHGAPVYEIKLISPEGRVMKVYYDARNGSVLKVKDKRP